MQDLQEERKKESIPGIISTIVALLLGGASIVLILGAFYMEVRSPTGLDESAPVPVVMGIVLFATIPFSFIGAILGFVGLFQKNRRRTFPVFGAFLNLMLFCGIVGLIVIGLLME